MKRFRAEDFWFKLDSREDPTGRVVRYYVVNCRECGQEGAFHCHGMSAEALRKYFQRRGWEIGKTQAHHLCPDCAKGRQSRLADQHVEASDQLAESEPSPEPEQSAPDPLTTILEALTSEEGQQIRDLVLEEFFKHASAEDIWRRIPADQRYPVWVKSPALELDAMWQRCSAADRAAFLNRIVGSISFCTPTESIPNLMAWMKEIGGQIILDEGSLSTTSMAKPIAEPRPLPHNDDVDDDVDDDDGPADWWKEMKAGLK